MKQTTALKVMYTGAAIVLGGLMVAQVIPDALKPFAQGACSYLMLHSFLPSAKTGSPQG